MTGNPRGETRRAQCAIAVMAKASIPGRTKTRLVPPFGSERIEVAQVARAPREAEALVDVGREPVRAASSSGSCGRLGAILI